ncbi:Hypothetical protein GbCGDNIH2_0609 [Granulibacter bethesdensis]|uniref:Uncharacterized protein n=1 Tax=Granulibacter bethesdensis TaxID=364410 RepID=A0AAN0VFC0_9PROT|nr:Hypothetical protein GbCGDNIH3_0609 [Granulibacter bethesdensis]AHJ67640.1 Hypothetical protein GbCGDNIH2_0609 [Granulibacter bethesdensis]
MASAIAVLTIIGLVAVMVAAIILLILLLRLQHRIHDAEIMLGMLEISFCRHTVSAAGRITTQLQIFLEQLLCRATYADIGAVTVENMVPVQRNIAIIVVAHSATAATSTAAAMVPSAHTFHIHAFAVAIPVRFAFARLRKPVSSDARPRFIRPDGASSSVRAVSAFQFMGGLPKALFTPLPGESDDCLSAHPELHRIIESAKAGSINPILPPRPPRSCPQTCSGAILSVKSMHTT